MAFIQEEIEHPTIDGVTLAVEEKEKHEQFDRNKIIALYIDDMQTYSPEQINAIGQWLILQAKRIRKEYTRTGKKKSGESHKEDKQ